MTSTQLCYDFVKKDEISNLIKIHPVEAKFFLADRQTERRREKANLLFVFGDFAKAPINSKKIG